MKNTARARSSMTLSSPLWLGHVVVVSLNGLGQGRSHAEGLVGTDAVVLAAPYVDHGLGLAGLREPLSVEDFAVQGGVETLVLAVPPTIAPPGRSL